jgi:hypothetical protein
VPNLRYGISFRYTREAADQPLSGSYSIVGTEINSEQPCDEFGWITVVRQSLGLQPPGDLVYLWSRVIGYDETPFLVVYNGMEQDFDLREFSLG